MQTEDKLLMMPGPVKVPSSVLRAMSKPMINHRSKDFSEIIDECQKLMSPMFNTNPDNIVIISGSGSAGMEAAIGSVINKGEKVISLENGKFGERFKEISFKYGDTVPLEFEWGDSFDLDLIEEKLDAGDISAITMVHNETSAGILNPAKEVGKLAKKYDALFILDVITSFGGDCVKFDEWGVDIAVAGSQKCIAAPPGLSMVAMSEKALSKMEETTCRPYYLDLLAYKNSISKEMKETPYTPAVSLFYGLLEALRIADSEGIENRIKRHRDMTKSVRDAMAAMGIEMFPNLNKYSKYSNTVSAMKSPEGLSGEDIKKEMSNRGIIIAGGQNRLKGKIFRIGSMGAVTPLDLMTTISELELILYENKVIDKIGEGMRHI